MIKTIFEMFGRIFLMIVALYVMASHQFDFNSFDGWVIKISSLVWVSIPFYDWFKSFRKEKWRH